MDNGYLEHSGADRMIHAMVQRLLDERPLKPAEFMIKYLQDNHLSKKRSSYVCYEGEIEIMEEDVQEQEQEVERAYFVVPESFKRKRRGAICCDVPNTQSYVKDVPKSLETRANLDKALSSNIMFSHLEADQLSQIFAAMFEVRFKANEIVFRQGDEGDRFYVIERGECDVYAMKPGGTSTQHVAQYISGSAFGELALIYDCPRISTVKARTDVVLWAIERVAFRSIIMETTMKARKIHETFLEKVPLLSHLTKAERAIVADSLTIEQYWDGDIIVQQEDEGDKFYIIVEGTVEISRSSEIVGRLEVSQYFGEIALLTDRPRSATITAIGNTKCVCLDRGSFNRLLGPIEDILRRNMEMYNLYISSNI